MAWGIGDGDGVQNYGNVQAGWQGAPYDGVDMQDQALVMMPWHAKVPSDTYLAMLILGALAVLWLLGGVAFKSVRF
jgi:hypothetical protein